MVAMALCLQCIRDREFVKLAEEKGSFYNNSYHCIAYEWKLSTSNCILTPRRHLHTHLRTRSVAREPIPQSKQLSSPDNSQVRIRGPTRLQTCAEARSLKSCAVNSL